MAVVSMQNLLESGAHFGHQARRWHPKMKKYIFAERNGVHIINLQKTIVAIREAFETVRRTIIARKSVLFVGTKKQAQKTIEREATKCGMHYVNHRWLGGILTNFSTIQLSIHQLKRIEKMESDGIFDGMRRKEVVRLKKKAAMLERNLGGIKEMKDLPGLIFVIDPGRESIALAEARRMKIPVIAVVDTNCNPQGIDYPIPGNDDAIRSITLFTEIISQAVVDADNEIGLEVIETLQDSQESGAFVPEETAETVAEEESSEEDVFVMSETGDQSGVSEYATKEEDPSLKATSTQDAEAKEEDPSLKATSTQDAEAKEEDPSLKATSTQDAEAKEEDPSPKATSTQDAETKEEDPSPKATSTQDAEAKEEDPSLKATSTQDAEAKEEDPSPKATSTQDAEAKEEEKP